MAKKKSVLFYLDNYTPAMKSLSYEQKGMLFDAIISYAGGDADTPEGLGMLALALDPIKAAIDRDNKKYVQICERNRKNGKKGGKPKQTQPNPTEPSGLFTNPNKPDTDTIQKKTKIKKEQSEDDFDKFWNMYAKKKDTAKCKAKWKKLSPSDKDEIFKTLGLYLESTPDKQYRKNPLTYLNGEIWKDDFTPEPEYNEDGNLVTPVVIDWDAIAKVKAEASKE